MEDKREPRAVSPIRGDEPTDLQELAHLAAKEGDGRLFKMEVDYKSQVDEALPKAAALAKAGDVVGALDSLSNLEKQSRLGSDMKSNARLLQAMVQLCFEGQKWDLLNDTILSLSKKRLIIKYAIAKMVSDCCAFVEKMPDDGIRMKLIETLRTITAGKIYVEIERARLTSIVVAKLEAEGKIDEAATMLLELQVETYGSMQMKEKVKYLLEQMRLSIARKDFVRASIISKKISTRFFDNNSEQEVQDMKLKFYGLMINIGLDDCAYMDVCRYYRAIFDTPCTVADKEKVKSTLKCCVVFVLLAAHSNEQWDMVHRLATLRELELIPEYKALLNVFMDEELISWKESIIGHYDKLLRKGIPTSASTGIFDGAAGEKRWEDLHRRVGEHNMRMISKYYTQISFDRLAELLDFPVDEMEKFVCEMIVSGAIVDAKLERPSRVVDLRARRAAVDRLDEWGQNVKNLTDTLNKVSHLILKEEMVHRAFESCRL